MYVPTATSRLIQGQQAKLSSRWEVQQWLCNTPAPVTMELDILVLPTNKVLLTNCECYALWKIAVGTGTDIATEYLCAFSGHIKDIKM
jgi:hypothetical protein